MLATTTTMTDCPVCGGDVGLTQETVISELIDCGECASELEVITLDPPRLEEAPEVAEDWGE
jgi:alpha-aminoadipate carrier protein LysW